MTAATEQQQPIARPLRVLVSLIKEDLEKGKEAAERAGMPHYLAAGEKLIEAKAQLQHGEFGPWVKRNFGISRTQVSRYMRLAEANGAQMFPAGNISSMRDFRHRHLGEDTTRKARPEIPPFNQPPIDQHKIEERGIRHKLALQLVNAGYRALAVKLHPDKGGASNEMIYLNQARDHLKKYAAFLK